MVRFNPSEARAVSKHSRARRRHRSAVLRDTPRPSLVRYPTNAVGQRNVPRLNRFNRDARWWAKRALKACATTDRDQRRDFVIGAGAYFCATTFACKTTAADNRCADRPVPHRQHRRVLVRNDRHSDLVQRLPDRQPHPSGRAAGVLRPRDLAHHRAEHPARRRHAYRNLLQNRAGTVKLRRPRSNWMVICANPATPVSCAVVVTGRGCASAGMWRDRTLPLNTAQQVSPPDWIQSLRSRPMIAGPVASGCHRPALGSLL
jgi:hypothetical protein